MLLMSYEVAGRFAEEREVEFLDGCGKHTVERREQLCRKLSLGIGGKLALQDGWHVGLLVYVAHGVVDGVVLTTFREVLVYARSEACHGNGCCHDKPHTIS